MRWPSGSSAAALAALVALLGLPLAGCGGDDAEGLRNTVLQSPSGWERAASMSQRRSYIAAAQVGNLIYTAGGMVGETGRPLATASRYDPAADRWQTLPQLPVPTRAAAGAALDGVVYVVVGTTPEGNTTAVWAWDGERWSARAPLPVPRFNHVAVALGGRLYVLGGYGDGVEHDEVFAYDPDADRWAQVSTLPRRNHAFGAVAFRGEIWVIGGRRGEEVLREVEIWSPESGEWREGPAMPEPMELLGAAVRGDEIHAVWESVYQVWDASEGEWRSGPHTRITRHADRRLHDRAARQPGRRAPCARLVEQPSALHSTSPAAGRLALV
jgi:hypothetical protein